MHFFGYVSFVGAGGNNTGTTFLSTATLQSKDLNTQGIVPDPGLTFESSGCSGNLLPSEGITTIIWRRPLDQGLNPILFNNGQLVCMVVASYAVDQLDGVNAKHTFRSNKGRYLNLITGQHAYIDRYATPIRVAHGVLMGTAFVILFPLGLLVARYGKSEAGTWFKIHFFLQNYAFIIMLTGIIIGYTLPAIQFKSFTAHAPLGTVIFILTFFQMASGYLRPHKGDPPSTARLVFEFFHHWNGRIILILTIAQIALGIIEIGVNNFAYGIWLPFLLVIFFTAIILEIRNCMSASHREEEGPVYKMMM